MTEEGPTFTGMGGVKLVNLSQMFTDRDSIMSLYFHPYRRCFNCGGEGVRFLEVSVMGLRAIMPALCEYCVGLGETLYHSYN